MMKFGNIASACALLAAAISMASCAQPAGYRAAGSAGSDFARDYENCQRQVTEMQGPMAPYTSGFGASSPGPSPPNGEALFRSREDRAQGMDSCLAGHGW